MARAAFEQAGGFVEWLEPDVGKAMAEDLWLAWRIRRAGGRTAFREDALVHHAVIPRGPREYIAERRRLRHFPEIAAKVPELRDTLFFARWFLGKRSGAFDAALASVLAAALLRSPWALAGGLPYAWLIGRRAARWRRRAPLVAAVEVASDAAGLAWLVRGSLASRTLVL